MPLTDLHCVLVLPTFNEAENIEKAIRVADAALATAPALSKYTILVVDDQSPDGTGQLAEELSKEITAVQVLHRTVRDGLAGAYIAGYLRAIELDADLAIQMDSDGSHDPNDLPRLIAALAGGADLALGSRYVPGGSVSNWSLPRRLLSRGGSCYSQLMLGIKISDVTGGFKCVRTSVLRAIDLAEIHSKGYAFNVELNYRVVKGGFTVEEVPIVFREREAGESKMNTSIAIEAIHRVPRLRWALRNRV